MDAEPWAPPPATIRASVPVGAPFDVSARLSAQGATFADGTATARTMVRAGETAGGNLVAQSAGGFALVSASVSGPTARRCLDGPCWRGFALTAGEPLALFVRGPQALTVSAPEALFGSALRLPLAALAAPAEAGGELSWRASSSDASVATVRIIGGSLLVEPEPGAEGTVLVEVTGDGCQWPEGDRAL